MLSCMEVWKDPYKVDETLLAAFWIQLKLARHDSWFRSDIYWL